jgi:hypothetical protein
MIFFKYRDHGISPILSYLLGEQKGKITEDRNRKTNAEDTKTRRDLISWLVGKLPNPVEHGRHQR